MSASCPFFRPLRWFWCLSLFSLVAVASGAEKPDRSGELKLRGAAFPVAEEAGEVTVTVRRVGGSSGEVAVAWELVPGTATAGEDYLDVSGSLSWDDGDRADKSFAITIVDDALRESQETFGVRLVPAEGVNLGHPAAAIVRIKPSDRAGGNDDGEDGDDSDDGDDGEDGDDDGEDDGDGDDEVGDQGNGNGKPSSKPSQIKLKAATFPAFEAAGEATVTLERRGGTGAASVDYMLIAGSALEGIDFMADAGTVSWGDGETGRKSFTVALFDDDERERPETITVLLTEAHGDAELGRRDSASVLIIDDDRGPSSCVPSDETLCLRDGRFQATGRWTAGNGESGVFHWTPATDAAGLAWFFSDENVEVLMKVLDGCALNGHNWVFYAATTDVEYTIEVTDLLTGSTRVYENPAGHASGAVTDVLAFATCREQ